MTSFWHTTSSFFFSPR